MNKPTGLAAFTRKPPAAQPLPAEDPPAKPSLPGSRRRGKGEIVALTVRPPRADWERLHQLAVAEGVSLQTLAVEGLSKVFAEKGLPGLSLQI